MLKTSRGQYFLRNGGTLSRAKTPLGEFHNTFKLYVFMHFPRFIKVESKRIFAILVIYSFNHYRFYQQP